MADRESRIRDEAYRIWNEAGRPGGDGQEYWLEAEKRIAAGEKEPVPPRAKPKKAEAAAAVPIARNAGNSGVQAQVVVLPEKPRRATPSKGDAVEIGLLKKRTASNANVKKPAIEKASASKPGRPSKPKS